MQLILNQLILKIKSSPKWPPHYIIISIFWLIILSCWVASTLYIQYASKPLTQISQHTALLRLQIQQRLLQNYPDKTTPDINNNINQKDNICTFKLLTYFTQNWPINYQRLTTSNIAQHHWKFVSVLPTLTLVKLLPRIFEYCPSGYFFKLKLNALPNMIDWVKLEMESSDVL